MEPMLWNHAYGCPTEPRETTNAFPMFDYGAMLEECWKEVGPEIAARREKALAELRAPKKSSARMARRPRELYESPTTLVTGCRRLRQD